MRTGTQWLHHSNITIRGFPEVEKWEKGAENLFEEITAENLPNLGKETDSPNKIHSMRSAPKHIVIVMAKVVIKNKF